MAKNIKRFFHSYQGRHFFSRWARKIFDRPSAQKFLGLGLVLAVFFSGVFVPETSALMETVQADSISLDKEFLVETTTEKSFRYPLAKFTLSQGFSWYHWGVDLSADEGTEVFPVAKGIVLEIEISSWGYGNYILIDHQNGQKSLYAHLAKQEIKKGEVVSKETLIGRVGHSGWSTGNHLHLEIYSGGLPLNPLEVLPER